MPLDDKLLEVLCCPSTKVPVNMLHDDKLKKLNARIKEGQVRYVGVEKVEEPVEEALITEDGKTIYTITSNIPIMLVDKGIAIDQLKDF